MKRYKLNIQRDVYVDDPNALVPNTVYLDLPKGFRFDVDWFDANDANHIRGFDNLRELKKAVATLVVPCECNRCK